MVLIDTDKLSPALQLLIGMELEHNNLKNEISKLRTELDELKEKILNDNDFSKYPIALTVNDIAGILKIGKIQAYRLVHQESFPKIMDGRRIIIPKAAFIKWLDSEAFRGIQYIKESGINGKEKGAK